MRRWVLAALVLLAVVEGAGAVEDWQSDSAIVGGLGDIGKRSTPDIFQMDSEWYLISGESNGGWSGYNWNGTGWQSNSTIIGSLGDVGYKSVPTVFQIGSTWYLVAGSYQNGWDGYHWTGSTWTWDSGIISGLSSGNALSPDAFQMGSTWYMIVGDYYGVFVGYHWTGSAWQSDSAIVSGLVDIGSRSNPDAFQIGSTWYMIAGRQAGTFVGHNWTGSAWQSDPAIVGGLVDVGDYSAPAVFLMDSGLYLISGANSGVFAGYTMPMYGATNLTHSMGACWVNHTWDTVDRPVDSWNVSINGTWYNNTVNRFYNHTLSAWLQWSNITVNGYIEGEGLGVYAVTEDVKLVAVPPAPIGLDSTWGYYWVNHTWTSGIGYVTDSYNVSVNDVWHNDTAEYYNNSLSSYGDWSNITVYAFNNTGVMSEVYIYQNVQAILAITNTSDWSGWEGETVYVDYDADIGVGSTPTFSCNRTDLFTDFNTVTGQGNWTAVGDTYYVDFGLADEFDHTVNYTMTLSVAYASPPTPTNLTHYFDDCFVTWTWDSETPGYADTDSYCVKMNYTLFGENMIKWFNQTANNHTFSIACADQLPTLTVWGYNNTFGCSLSAAVDNVTLLCRNATDIAFNPANYSTGTLAGQHNWECVAGSSSVVQVHSGSIGYPWWQSVGTRSGETATILTCPASTHKLFISFWITIYDQSNQANSNTVTIRVGGSSPDNPYIFKFYTDMTGNRRVYNGTGNMVWNAYTHGNGVYWERYDFVYDRDNNDLEMWRYRVNGDLLTHVDGLPTIHSDSNLVYFSNAVNFYDCWLNGCIAAVDDIYVQSINGSYGCYGECTEDATTVLLKDCSGNLVNNAKVAIYDKTDNEYLQRWTTDENGIISLHTLLYNDTTFLFMVKTFDGVFTQDIYINPGDNIVNLTIPIRYDVKVHPQDQFGVPLTDVFCGLSEYTPLNPQAFWGVSMYGSQYVPITNCSGFAMCDIYAEKGGYEDYNATALNWTSKSAMVKDYRHTATLTKE